MEKYKLLVKFNYENKNYYIVQIGKNKIEYVLKDKEKFSIKIENKDLEIFNYIFNSLKIDTNNSINLGIQKINNKQFMIFYDPKVKLYYWYKIQNSELVEADDLENIKLNFRYNHMPLVVNLDSETENKIDEPDNSKFVNKLYNTFIDRIMRIGNKVLVISIASAIALTTFSQCTSKLVINNPDVSNIITENTRIKRLEEEYDYNKIKDAIKSNLFLSDKEKELLYNLKFVFDENYKYMYLEQAIDRLGSLRIIYNKESNGILSGTYSNLGNLITIYNATSIEDTPLEVIVHEILHVFQTDRTNNILFELSNELFSREVVRRLDDMGYTKNREEFKNEYGSYTKYGEGYRNYMFAEYFLAEILTQNQMKDYQWWTDDDIIIDSLVKIDSKDNNSESLKKQNERAYKLINTINSMRTYNEEKNKYEYVEDLDEYLKIYNDIYEQIDYYYTKLYGKSMEKNLAIGLTNYDLYNESVIDNTSVSDKFENNMKENERPNFYSNIRSNAIDITLPLLARRKTNQYSLRTDYEAERKNDHLFSRYIYVLPKSYFSDKYKNPIIYFNPNLCEDSVVEINEDAQNRFLKNYNLIRKVKENVIYESNEER